jgi:formylglycine-generating enzyme required for sulfatase activity
VAAEAAAQRERKRAEEVLRLSAFQQLDDLVREADELWPISTALTARYERWLSAAADLAAKLPSHEATLSELRARGTATTSEGRASWAFDTDEDRWWHAQLTKLVESLKEFIDEEHGLASAGISLEHGWGIVRRLALVGTIEERSLTSPEACARWEEALASIRDDYEGLELTPQFGLLPIGQDPESGLWEFAHLLTGEPPERDSDGKLIRADGVGLVLVLLPGGTFWMGAQSRDRTQLNFDPQAQGDENPVRRIQLSSFFLSKHEMTQGQWERVTGKNPSYFGPGDRLPVEQVNWIECEEVCRHMGLDLPSEAQWEYGTRAGTETPWWSGDEPHLLAEVANLADRSYRTGGGARDQITEDWDDGAYGPNAGGRYSANLFGLHDVHGNVWEWCLDWYADYRTSGEVLRDPVQYAQQGSSVRVSRGGSFVVAASNARSADRNGDSPSVAGRDLGCRPARRNAP